MLKTSFKKIKVIEAFILTAIFLCLLIFASPASAALLGDVNNDGVINILDVTLVNNQVLGISTLTDSQQEVADVNGDGFINILDVTLIAQMSLGIITQFPAQATTLPAAPTLTSPALNAFVASTSINFQWTASSGANKYQLEISRESDGVVIKNPVLGNVISSTQTGFPNNGTIYRWRVRAGNDTGWGVWSSYRTFTNGSAPAAPPVPGLFSPADSANAIGTSIIFQWNASSGADKYELEVQKVSDNVIFKNPVLENVTSTTQTGFPNDGTQYRWRVRAGNDAGWSAWSDYRIINNGVLPAAPTLVSPANTINVAGISVSFQWSASTGANKYELEIVRESDGFVRKVPLGNVTSSTQSGFPNNGTAYKWRVRAGNHDGWGAWSVYRTFTNGNTPAPPALIAPADNAVVFSTSLIFDWKLSGGATKYELLIRRASNDAVYRTIPLTGNVGSYLLTGLPNDGTQFKWAVRAGNNNGWGSYSAYRTFTNGFLFAAPVQIIPAANATVSNTTIGFEWTEISSADRYHLELVNINKGTAANIYPGDEVYTAQDDFPHDGTQYRWRVRAGSASGWGAWSGYRDFINYTPNNDSLAAPSLLSPASGATAGGTSVTFKWTAVSGVNNYELEVVRLSDRQVVFKQLVFGSTTHEVNIFPDDGTQYIWRVRARAGVQTGYWSLYRGFVNGRSSGWPW